MPDQELQVVQQPQKVSVRKPQQDTKFAKKAADLLVDIVKQNHWNISIGGGKGDHLVYEAWQTLGKYYGYSVITGQVQEVEIAGVAGFKAIAKVVDEKTGVEIGGAEAFCMRDEYNWKAKPVFQLASMAQTRAGAKALRQILSFVVALAGYNPTPAEEMVNVDNQAPVKTAIPEGTLITITQIQIINNLLREKNKTQDDLKAYLEKKFGITNMLKLTKAQAEEVITKVKTLEDPVSSAVEVQVLTSEDDVDIDEVDEGIEKQRKERENVSAN